jgi:C-terminal processing protease CtpA/Prc
MIIRKQTKLNGINISLTETINEEKISSIIKKYMDKYECYVDNITFEEYFHNLNVRYHGMEFKIRENKKGYEKVLVG